MNPRANFDPDRPSRLAAWKEYARTPHNEFHRYTPRFFPTCVVTNLRRVKSGTYFLARPYACIQLNSGHLGGVWLVVLSLFLRPASLRHVWV